MSNLAYACQVASEVGVWEVFSLPFFSAHMTTRMEEKLSRRFKFVTMHNDKAFYVRLPDSLPRRYRVDRKRGKLS